MSESACYVAPTSDGVENNDEDATTAVLFQNETTNIKRIERTHA